MSGFSGEDLVFYKENDKIMSGGYSIDSFMLKQGLSPMMTVPSNEKPYNGNGGTNKNEDSVSSIFENLAVPVGLFYVTQRVKVQDSKKPVEYEEHTMLNDDIHEKLFGFIEMDKKHKRKTRKSDMSTNKKHKKTRKTNEK